MDQENEQTAPVMTPEEKKIRTMILVELSDVLSPEVYTFQDFLNLFDLE